MGRRAKEIRKMEMEPLSEKHKMKQEKMEKKSKMERVKDKILVMTEKEILKLIRKVPKIKMEIMKQNPPHQIAILLQEILQKNRNRSPKKTENTNTAMAKRRVDSKCLTMAYEIKKKILWKLDKIY